MEFWEFRGMASAQGGRRLQADGVDLTFQIVEDIRLSLHSGVGLWHNVDGCTGVADTKDHYKPK